MQARDHQQSVTHTTHLHSTSIVNVIKAGGNTNIKINRLYWDTHTFPALDILCSWNWPISDSQTVDKREARPMKLELFA